MNGVQEENMQEHLLLVLFAFLGITHIILFIATRRILLAHILTIATLVTAITRARAARRSIAARGAVASGVTASLLVAVVLTSVALLGGAHANIRGVSVTLELSVIKSFNGILHILAVGKFNYTLTRVAVNVGVNNISHLAHKIFQILPTATARKVSNNHTIFGSSATSTARGFISSVSSVPSVSSTVTLGELNTESVTVEVVSITTTDCILSIPVIIEGNEGKCRRTGRCLQVNLTDLSVFVEKIIKLGFSDVQRKIANVDSAGHC
mmetsp:Transcript_14691/g.29793  ORF Transcript_14691/g.29793 Transcript_14691/m.29793 type:complete len:267 (-) Transcript_14691:17-817(-)